MSQPHLQIVTAETVLMEAGGYLRRMTRSRPNMIARGQRSYQHIVNSYLSADKSRDFEDTNSAHYGTLQRAVTDADTQLARLPVLKRQSDQLPWAVWVFSGRGVENGMPHTHGRLICLNLLNVEGDQTALVQTVLHERVHVLQREWPAFWHRIQLGIGWRPLDAATTARITGRASRRMNPDLPEGTWQSWNGDSCYTDLGAGLDLISDIRLEWMTGDGSRWNAEWGDYRQSEHPHEISAVALESIITRTPNVFIEELRRMP